MSNEVDIWYIRVPLVAGLDNRLKPNAKLLLGEIVNLAEVKGYAFARNKHYMKRLAITEATVINAMANLEEEGYIRRWFDHSKKNNTVRRIYVNYDKLIQLTEEYRQSLNDQPEVNDEVETPISFAESSQVEQTDYKSFEETIKPIVNDYKEYSQVPQNLGSETIKSGEHKKSFKNLINILPKNELEEGYKHENSPSQQKSEEAAELSSKDNRVAKAPLSPPIGGDAPLSNNTKSVSLRDKEKINYIEREYLLLADAYMSVNATNVDDAYSEYELLIKNLISPSSIAKRIDKANDPSLTLGEYLKAEFPLILKSFIEEKTSS